MDPAREWQRLTNLYSEMSDEELRELAAEFEELTEVAQGVLRDALKRRGLEDAITKASTESVRHTQEDNSKIEEAAPWILREGGMELGELREILERAGIDSQVVNPQDNYYHAQSLQLQVREEDAERAEVVLAQHREPSSSSHEPEDIADDWITPTCTQCGASDPLLESVEPFNTWFCENCGTRWVETAEDTESGSLSH